MVSSRVFHQAQSEQRAREGDLGIETKPPVLVAPKVGGGEAGRVFCLFFLSYNGPLDTTPNQPGDKRNIHSKAKDKNKDNANKNFKNK